MNDRLGSYELYKPDTKTHINPEVLRATILARTIHDPDELINCLYGGKSLEDIRSEKSTRNLADRKKDLEDEIGARE